MEKLKKLVVIGSVLALFGCASNLPPRCDGSDLKPVNGRVAVAQGQ